MPFAEKEASPGVKCARVEKNEWRVLVTVMVRRRRPIGVERGKPRSIHKYTQIHT
jgi:hypothetical protein